MPHKAGLCLTGTGKVLGPEKVTVPAGAFDAIKIEISGNRPFSGGPAQTETGPVRLKHQIWYAPKVKRVVKHARNTYAPKGNDLDRDLYELVEYRAN
jgi:hypothetical protein